jgi:hypothetical protein
MTNTVQLKRSNVANSVPSAGNLVPGELAINYTDGNLFYKNSSNVVTVIASNQFVSVSGNITGGNVLTGGVVSATGNITGNYIFGNGSQLTGLAAGTANSALQLLNGTTNLSTAPNGNANLTIGGTSNVVVWDATGQYVTGVVSASGNVTGNYFIGNGSQLTGINATSSQISNGTSNVAIVTANGNVQVAVAAVANSVVIGAGSLFVQGPISTPKVINTLALVPNVVNAVMISPLTISALGNIFVPTDSTLTIFTPT